MSKHHKKYGTGRGNYTGHRGATGWFDLNAAPILSMPITTTPDDNDPYKIAAAILLLI